MAEVPSLTMDRDRIEMWLERAIRSRVGAGSTGMALRLVAPRGGEIVIGVTLPGLDVHRVVAFIQSLRRAEGVFRMAKSKFLPNERWRPRTYSRVWAAPTARWREDYLIQSESYERPTLQFLFRWLYVDTSDRRGELANAAFTWILAQANRFFRDSFRTLPDLANTLMNDFAALRF